MFCIDNNPMDMTKSEIIDKMVTEQEVPYDKVDPKINKAKYKHIKKWGKCPIEKARSYKYFLPGFRKVYRVKTSKWHKSELQYETPFCVNAGNNDCFNTDRGFGCCTLWNDKTNKNKVQDYAGACCYDYQLNENCVCPDTKQKLDLNKIKPDLSDRELAKQYNEERDFNSTWAVDDANYHDCNGADSSYEKCNNNRYPLDCSKGSNDKNILCMYAKNEKKRDDRQWPIDCSERKYKFDREFCAKYNDAKLKKKKYEKTVYTPEQLKKKKYFSSKWEKSETLAKQKKDKQKINEQALDLLEKTNKERLEILNKMDTSKRTKIENELKEIFKKQNDKEILEISQNLLDLSEIEQKTELSKMSAEKKIKVQQKINELKNIQSKPTNINKELDSFNIDLDEVVKILYIAQQAKQGTETDLNNINSALVDSFRVTIEEQIERERQLDIKRQKIKKHGWDINNFDGQDYWIYNADKTDFKGGMNMNDFDFKKYNSKIYELPEDIHKKALLVQASHIFSDNHLDIDIAKKFLKDNNLNYHIDKVLSNDFSLVLQDLKTNDLIIAFRGTDTTNSSYDLLTDAKIFVGTENDDQQFEISRKQIQTVERKYKKLPIQLLGFSKGYSIAWKLGDELGIDTIGFNGFIGKSILKSDNPDVKHVLWRTTDDLPSIGAGFNKNLKNWTIKNIYPLQKSKSYAEAHYLINFTEKGKRKTSSKMFNMMKNTTNKNQLEKNIKKTEDNIISNTDFSQIKKGKNVIFSFDKYKLVTKNNKIYLYDKDKLKLYTNKEFNVLVKKKLLKNNHENLKKLEQQNMKKQGWTIIIKNNREYYIYNNKEQFDSKIYRLFNDDGTYRLFNTYTKKIVSIQEAKEESLSLISKIFRAIDSFMSVKQHGSIPYRLSTVFFLSFILGLFLYLIENFSIIIVHFISQQTYNFITEIIDLEYSGPEQYSESFDNFKNVLKKITLTDFLKKIHIDDWIYFPLFYFMLCLIAISCKFFLGGSSFTVALTGLLISTFILGFIRAYIIYYNSFDIINFS